MSNPDYQALENTYGLTLYPKRDAVLVRGKGALLYDEHNNEYIDCAAGIGVANVGHCHPDVVAAIQKQAGELMVVPNTLYNDKRSQLLQKLVQLSPDSIERAYLCNSGTEAVEAALKFARVSTGRTEYVTAMRGFHGRTMGAVSATFTKKYRDPFAPLVPGFSYVPLNKIDKLDAAVTEKTAAVMLELVQGEGGVNLADRAYIDAVKRICDERGALLIVDEIQTGFCRTGRFFACEHFDLQPDMITVAKAIAAGIPMGATLLGEKIKVEPGMHGTTFGGNPIASAAALATLGVMENENLASRAEEMGSYLQEKLAEKPMSQVRSVRRLGLMIGLELKVKVQPVLEELMRRRVIALPAGATVLRMLPPLVIDKSQIDRVVEQLHELLA
ncbi:acetylornithine aminotransferase [Chromatiales bacterium (ex Bugula neritina AB1)]|nr:acetylornithine aminotransferase [Chromatiales bacterium (ex Bugula neritina AB1)]